MLRVGYFYNYVFAHYQIKVLFSYKQCQFHYHNVLSWCAAFNKGAQDWGSSWGLEEYFATGLIVSLQSFPILLVMLDFKFGTLTFTWPSMSVDRSRGCVWKVDDWKASVGESLFECVEAKRGGCFVENDELMNRFPPSLFKDDAAGDVARYEEHDGGWSSCWWGKNVGLWMTVLPCWICLGIGEFDWRVGWNWECDIGVWDWVSIDT